MGNATSLKAIGEKLLSSARTELYLAMRFLGPALMSLEPKMDMSVRTVGTDARTLYYHPVWVMNTFMEHPYVLTRAYLHVIIHCLFRHMYSLRTHTDRELWDLSADIAAEALIDSMDAAAVRRTPSDFRTDWYERLSAALGVLTAERVYSYFLRNTPEDELLVRLGREFASDDHHYWDQLDSDGDSSKDSPPGGRDAAEEAWQRASRRVKSELMSEEGRFGRKAGDLSRVLSFELTDRISYRSLLEKFAVYREEMRVDPDSFDYGFYNYGMELYGNMPLIEENEFALRKTIRELVIAIDTSASIDENTLRTFLSETAGVLLERERFSQRFEIHIVECDAKIQEEMIITDPDELTALAGTIELKGGGGTDFRPVFRFIDDRKRKGFFRNLAGLIYFTDGFGVFPEEAPPYLTAAVVPEDGLVIQRDIPNWVLEVCCE